VPMFIAIAAISTRPGVSKGWIIIFRIYGQQTYVLKQVLQ